MIAFAVCLLLVGFRFDVWHPPRLLVAAVADFLARRGRCFLLCRGAMWAASLLLVRGGDPCRGLGSAAT